MNLAKPLGIWEFHESMCKSQVLYELMELDLFVGHTSSKSLKTHRPNVQGGYVVKFWFLCDLEQLFCTHSLPLIYIATETILVISRDLNQILIQWEPIEIWKCIRKLLIFCLSRNSYICSSFENFLVSTITNRHIVWSDFAIAHHLNYSFDDSNGRIDFWIYISSLLFGPLLTILNV